MAVCWRTGVLHFGVDRGGSFDVVVAHGGGGEGKDALADTVVNAHVLDAHLVNEETRVGDEGHFFGEERQGWEKQTVPSFRFDQAVT